MGKSKSTPSKHSMCTTCGTLKQCQNCGGKGHWTSHPEIPCGHCNGSGQCPVNN